MFPRTISRNWLKGQWLLAFFSLFAGVATAQDVSWIVPEDGGTPRDLNRIVRLGPGEYRINAAFEEGGPEILLHAVSRVELVCRNDNQKSVPVTLHFELSADGQRTDYDTKPESGMKLRDFIFIHPPAKGWRQINGTTEGWIATVKFDIEPGDTKIGLSPWYPYADYLRFVSSVPPHPHVEKKLVGKSDGGREQWELTITDPSVAADQKRTIFWHAREHAYETWSSFAMEGLVAFLMSDAAAEFRKRYIITLHPMTNVDGVALGYEYRGGYDVPHPRRTATGRLTLETIDRLRPDFAVAWHNWIAPRDRNVVFYTDGDGGKGRPRAWLRFTQLFPSLRGAGHRWKDETTPLRYNWEGRNPLSESNPHQYAMKKYGTRVWGWEMPWWNYSVTDARAMGALFARAFLTTLDEIRANTVPADQLLNTVDVPRWEMHEFRAEKKAIVDNPYRDAALVGEFVSPSGKTRVVDGFYDGGSSWKLRFAPDEEGEWTYLLRGEGVEVLQRGKISCTKARGRGAIRIHPKNPYAFAYADGTPFFPLGDTCYGLFDDSPITPELRTEYLKTRRTQRFNFVRMTIGHSEKRAAADSSYWAWGGSAQNPDLDRFNPDFFRKFDDLMLELRAQGMNVEMIVLNFYRRPFTDLSLWTDERERAWLHYVITRYAAFDNVFLWTLANEYETHPDGRYRLDFPDDVEWAKATARFIKDTDPAQHLITVHPVISASRQGESPRSPFTPPWRIGEFFGRERAIDVLSHQTGQSGDGTAWDENQQCWTGDAKALVSSVRVDRGFGKPVLNSENGYEYLRGHPTGRKQVHHTDKVRHSAWRIVCAGGYIAAGFHGTLGHSDAWNRIDPTNRYTFTLKDEGAAAQLGILHDFFAAFAYWRMSPFDGVTDDAVALAEPGKLYVAYLPRGGSMTLDLVDTSGQFTGRWFNPRVGKFEGDFRATGGSQINLNAPDAQDWAVLLETVKPN